MVQGAGCQDVFTVTDGQVVPIDGKTVRRSYKKSIGKKAVHMVSAWAAKNSLVLEVLTTEALFPARQTRRCINQILSGQGQRLIVCFANGACDAPYLSLVALGPFGSSMKNEMRFIAIYFGGTPDGRVRHTHHAMSYQ